MTQEVKKMTRQRRWQLKKIALGLCSTCGRRKIYYSGRCKECSQKNEGYKKVWREKHPSYHIAASRAFRIEHPMYNKDYAAKMRKLKE